MSYLNLILVKNTKYGLGEFVFIKSGLSPTVSKQFFAPVSYFSVFFFFTGEVRKGSGCFTASQCAIFEDLHKKKLTNTIFAEMR